MHWLLEVWFWSMIGAALTCSHIADLRNDPDSRFAIYVIALCPVVNTLVTALGIVIVLCTALQVILDCISD